MRKEFYILILVVVGEVFQDLSKSILDVKVPLNLWLHLLNCLGHIHPDIWNWVLLKSHDHW
jgi:hypothetical protein